MENRDSLPIPFLPMTGRSNRGVRSSVLPAFKAYEQVFLVYVFDGHSMAIILDEDFPVICVNRNPDMLGIGIP